MTPADRNGAHPADMAEDMPPPPEADPRSTVDHWPLTRLDIAELRDLPPSNRWLLRAGSGPKADPLFPRGRVGLLAGAGGVCKTMALCGLALAVATGRPWLQAGWGAGTPDGYGVAEPGNVALLLAEEDRPEVIRRLYQAARLMGLSASDLQEAVARLWISPLAGVPVDLVERDKQGNVEATDRAQQLFDKLASLADGEGWALVIVDPLSRFGGVNAETDNGAATRAVQALEALTKLPGEPSVMVAHHERKGSAKDATAGQEAVRGASAIVDAGRWVTRLVAVEVGGELWESSGGHRGVLLKVVKSNYSLRPRKPRLLMLDREHAGAPRVASEAECAEWEAAVEAARPKRSGGGRSSGPSVEERRQEVRRAATLADLEEIEMLEAAAGNRKGVRDEIAKKRALFEALAKPAPADV